jgi:hypothetical protein
MTMDPKDRKSEASQAENPERDLDAADLAMIRSAWSGLESAEPPELVDQAVLNIARREIATRKRRSLRWIGAFATASVMVLAITIVVQQSPEPLNTGRSNGARLDAPPLRVQEETQSGPAEPQKESFSDAPNGELQESILPESRAMESASGQDRMMKQSVAAKRERGVRSEAPTEPAAAAAAEIKRRSEDVDLRADGTAADLEPNERFRDEAVQAGTESAQYAPPPAMTAESEQAMDETVQSPGTPAAASPETEQDEAASMLPDPDEWIQRMLLLRQSELFEQLAVELAAFRQAYPDHPLPPELED